MIQAEIILESGEKAVLFLSDRDLRKLKYEVKEQREFEEKNGETPGYTMAEELAFMARQCLNNMEDPEDEEEPTGGRR